MKKETILKFLAYFCFLLPGTVKSRKRWYLRPLAILSFLAFLFVLHNFIYDFFGYKQFVKDERVKEALMRLKQLPARAIGLCLKSLHSKETLIEIKKENGVTVVDKVAVEYNGSTVVIVGGASDQNSQAKLHHPMSDLEDIISSAYRLLIGMENIIIRLFLWYTFPSLVALLTSIFQPPSTTTTQQLNDGEFKRNGFMCLLWREASRKWSKGETIFLSVIILSQFQREMDYFFHYYTSIKNTGTELLVLPCVITQLIIEQTKILLSRELAMEIVSLFLVVIMRSFVNVLGVIASGQIDHSVNDYDGQEDYFKAESFAFYGEEIGKGKHFRKLGKQASDMLFVKTQAMLMKTGNMEKVDRGIGSIDEQISGIIGSTKKPSFHDGEREALAIINRKKIGERYGESSTDADVIYSQINFIISMYFDLMGIWEQASRFTGVVTLLLFCELTSSFCFNTYIMLDTSMQFGLLSGFGISGLMRGIVIVTKFACVCNAAQSLRDVV